MGAFAFSSTVALSPKGHVGAFSLSGTMALPKFEGHIVGTFANSGPVLLPLFSGAQHHWLPLQSTQAAI
jgi:hypothetical protein